ncbi:MAG: hypothetical protein US50_C0055G0003 [Candidatus Nomurabacteria bacterium GW2011_GWB1_37_5]|uniref:Transglycosylase SLT domain-containing protein n=1 Tax=Candidatus Nomurabacteria bacterium GW2011_GWB1_37_5 TaxID=1618742 RepID=A0A0G0JBU2_9BACT|nr:MAG: hypothetical protein US50_C0055G0003 [Candidatus Nomurabacteria bacterium GW2011_GWB1_37_5]
MSEEQHFIGSDGREHYIDGQGVEWAETRGGFYRNIGMAPEDHRSQHGIADNPRGNFLRWLLVGTGAGLAAYKFGPAALEKIEAFGKGLVENKRSILPENLSFETFSWNNPTRKLSGVDWPQVRRWYKKVNNYLDSTQSQGETLMQIISEYGYDPLIITLSIIWVESKGIPDAQNPRSHATGLMQVMPSDGNGANYGIWKTTYNDGKPIGRVWHGYFTDRPTREQLKDPDTNIQWGTQIMANYITKSGLKEGLNNYYGANGYGGLMLALHNKILGI